MLQILIGYKGSDASNALLGDLCHAVLPERAEALVASVAELCCAPANIDEAGKRALHAAMYLNAHTCRVSKLKLTLSFRQR